MFNSIRLSYFSPNSRIPNSEFRFDDPQIIEESNRSFNQNNISEQICHFTLNSFELESIPVKIQPPNQNPQNNQTQYQNQQPNSTKSNSSTVNHQIQSGSKPPASQMNNTNQILDLNGKMDIFLAHQRINNLPKSPSTIYVPDRIPIDSLIEIQEYEQTIHNYLHRLQDENIKSLINNEMLKCFRYCDTIQKLKRAKEERSVSQAQCKDGEERLTVNFT